MLKDEISAHLIKYGYHWRVEGKDHAPTPKDVGEVLDKARTHLVDSMDGDQLEVGSLIIRREGQSLIVYTRFGEY